MSVGAIYIASRGLVLNNSVGSVNLFPWVHYDNWSRGQLSRNPLGGVQKITKRIKMDQSNTKRNVYLLIGGMFSLTFAVFQISAIFWSRELLIYFGGPVKMQAENPILYFIVCVFVGALIAICGLYALSGAGKFRRLPLLRTVLVAVTIIFILRGLLIIPILKILFTSSDKEVFRFLVFSIIALGIGIIHLAGVIRLFKLGRPERITT
jgi:hypothetical protein